MEAGGRRGERGAARASKRGGARVTERGRGPRSGRCAVGFGFAQVSDLEGFFGRRRGARRAPMYVPFALTRRAAGRSNTRPLRTVPTPSRTPGGQVAQLVEQRIENPRVVGSIPTLATIIQRPTSIGWAFSFPGSATPRGVRRRSACATPWRPGVLKSPGSTLFCSQFSQNLRQLLRRSTRRRPFVAMTCACVTAIGCPSRLDDQGIRPTQWSGLRLRASSTDPDASA